MRARTLSAAVLGLLLGAAPLAAEQVGVAVRVVRQASWKVVGGAWSPLPELAPVDLGWNLLTGRASALVVTFRPHGFLQLGEKTRIVLDRPKVAQATGCSNPEAYVLDGVLRIVHATPEAAGNVALVCGRVYFASPELTGEGLGTDIRLHVDPRLGTIVHVAQGTAIVAPRARDGEEVRVEAGQAVLVAPDGSVSALPVPWDPGLGFPGFLDDPPLLEGQPRIRDPGGDGPLTPP